MKRLVISIVLAGLTTWGIVALAQLPSGGPTILSLVILPFYMLGAVFSHNAHAPNELVSYSCMYLFFLLVCFGAQVIWSRCRGTTSK